MGNNILPHGIIQLEYSEKQRMFHFNDSIPDYKQRGWVPLKVISEDDAISFCDEIDKKYVKGRKSGILPELSVVRLEMKLFFELKSVRRKLAGR